MSALASSVSTFIDGLLYRGREGHWLYIGHRLAGLGTLLFLAVHIVDTATVYFFPSLYPHAVDIYRSTPFMIGEILLVVAVIYHGVNGLKIILGDTFPHWWTKRDERQSFWRVAVLCALFSAPPVLMMANSLYLNNICQCAPETKVDVSALNNVASNFALIAIPVLFVVILAVLAFGAPITRAGGEAARAVAVPARSLETYAWLFMRWSGGLLIPLVWVHVLIQDVLVGVHAITTDFVALRWAMLGWRVFDIALLAFAFGHGMNGLRGVANDYVRHPGWIKVVHWAIFLGWVAITAIGAVAIVGGVRR
jgi:succinate dehydrogenase cytochrome b556 subunit